jgi:4-hydroxybenzoate polyprenyltransferase
MSDINLRTICKFLEVIVGTMWLLTMSAFKINTLYFNINVIVILLLASILIYLYFLLRKRKNKFKNELLKELKEEVSLFGSRRIKQRKINNSFLKLEKGEKKEFWKYVAIVVGCIAINFNSFLNQKHWILHLLTLAFFCLMFRHPIKIILQQLIRQFYRLKYKKRIVNK